MKRAIFAVVLLTVGCFSLPVFAQQQDLQEVMNAANALSARESELLSKKDAAGIASLFTSDGLLVMLAPQFAFKPGRDAIQKHYQGIIDAGATSITLELKNLELRGNDGVWAAGNYSVTVKDKTIQGNWFRILKRENGNWKIAMEAFARAGVIDAPPAATGSPPPPANSTIEQRSLCAPPRLLACARRHWNGRRWSREIKMVQKDSVNTSRPCTSLTITHSSGSSCSPACFNSLIPRAAKLRAFLHLAGWCLPYCHTPWAFSACEYKMVSRQVCHLVRQRK